MAIARVERIEPGQQGLKLRFDARQLVSAVAGVEATCFTPTDDAVMVEAQLQSFNRCGGAPADGQRDRFGERKPTQSPAHANGAPIFKLTQDPGIRH